MRPSPADRVRRGVTARWERGEGLGPVGWALAPVALLYRFASGAYHGLYDTGIIRPRAVPVPVLSVGNLTVGGAGKTPVTRWLVDRLRERGRRPAVLHGGYEEDEPALHRRWNPEVPVLVGRDRVRNARRAAEAGADVVVLDDAFQHRRLARDLDVALVAAEGWTGAASMLPRGPWREPLSALARADLVCITRKIASADAAARAADGVARRADMPVARLWLRPGGWTDGRGVPRHGEPGQALGVAGVAGPASFFVQAEDAGARLGDTLAYPDHHRYDRRTLAAIRDAAGAGPVVTTAKDAVKLVDGLDPARLWVLEQEVAVEQGMAFIEQALDGLLS